MMETGKNVDGFQFNSDIEISKALEDKRKIDRLKEKIDFDDIDAAIALYNKIVERSFFESVVGYSFLHELSNQIRDKKKCKLKPIPVQNEDIKTNLIIKTDVYAEKMKKLKEDNEKQNMKIRKMTITIVALLAIVVGMIFIMATTDKNLSTNWQGLANL